MSSIVVGRGLVATCPMTSASAPAATARSPPSMALGATHPDPEVGILKRALGSVRAEVAPYGVPIPHIPELDGPAGAAA